MAAVTLASWAILGFAGFRSYPHVLSVLTRLLEGKGYSSSRSGSRWVPATVAERSPGSSAGRLGSRRASRPTPGRRRLDVHRRDGSRVRAVADRWLHYFVLLYVPIAIVRPRLSWLWALPLAFWICRGQSIDGAVWHKVRKHKDLALHARIGSALTHRLCDRASPW